MSKGGILTESILELIDELDKGNVHGRLVGRARILKGMRVSASANRECRMGVVGSSVCVKGLEELMMDRARARRHAQGRR